MAKSKSGGTRSFIRGSVGSETYSIGMDGKGKKQQIVRAKAVEVANPRTRAQAAQRLKLAPITYARTLLTDVVNHSFKGVAVGQLSYQHFLSINLQETDVPYMVKGSLNREIGGYTIAEGTLGDARLVRDVFKNQYISEYGESQATTPVLQLTTSDTSAMGNFKTYAEISQAILSLNPSLKNGDEIAVIQFVNVASGKNHGLVCQKHRMVLDVNFTTDTPAQWFVTKPASGDDPEQTLDMNILYALSQWNDDAVDFLNALKADNTYFPIDQPYAGCFYGFNLYMGLTANVQTGSGDAAILGWNVAHAPENQYALKPSKVEDAFRDGHTVAVALVISRYENGSWDFTISDIMLNEYYLKAVNSESRLEAAIASYMTGETIRSGQDQYFLRLDTGDTIPAAPLAIKITAGKNNYVSVSTVQGFSDPASGTKYIVVNDSDKVLAYLGGPVVKSSVSDSATEDTTIDMVKEPTDVVFIKESAVVASN